MPGKRLKKGFTTGAAASAAAKAGLLHILGTPPVFVEISFLTGEKKQIPVAKSTKISDHACQAVVVKDAGDDPDVTHQAEIGATVRLEAAEAFEVVIAGGKGVGTITLPGLETAVGEPAINPGPRKMIRAEIEDAYQQHSGAVRQMEMENARVTVEIFVPEGEKLAEKTLNRRLGIVGGISILGTTGIVTPMSHDAYIATIKSGIDVAAAAGSKTLVFTTGRRSERFAMGIFPDFEEVAFIQIGDFFKKSLDAAASCAAVNQVIHAVFFGKAVKMAMGFEHTHAAKSELTLKTLGEWTMEKTGNQSLARQVAQSNTARQAFSFLYPAHPEVIDLVADHILSTARGFSRETMDISLVIFDFDGNVVLNRSSSQCKNNPTG